MRSLEAVIQASWITRRSKITQLLKKMIEIINRKKSDVVPPLPRVTHYRGLPWDDVCFCLFLILLHQPAFHSRAPFRERSLRMQIMLGSLQRLHSGLKARGRERKRRFHIQSKPNVWGGERRECTGENGETEVEEKGATSERRKKRKEGNGGGKKGSEAEQILRLWRHSGTSLNCSRFFLLLLDALCIHVLRPVVSSLIRARVRSALWCSVLRRGADAAQKHAHLHGDYSVY